MKIPNHKHNNINNYLSDCKECLIFLDIRCEAALFLRAVFKQIYQCIYQKENEKGNIKIFPDGDLVINRRESDLKFWYQVLDSFTSLVKYPSNPENEVFELFEKAKRHT